MTFLKLILGQKEQKGKKRAKLAKVKKKSIRCKTINNITQSRKNVKNKSKILKEEQN